MPDLLLELLSEEIPARMQGRAADDLKRLVTDALVEAGLPYEGAKAFATPRRLALVVGGLPARQPDRSEERKGPRVGAPDKAIEGFLKAAGLASIDEAVVQADPKGDFYVARATRPGRASAEVIAEIVPAIVRAFPWPKSMRWGVGQLRWVRPLYSIVATFGSPQEDPEIVAFEVDGIVSGDLTRGHRVHAPAPFRVRRFEDYEAGLLKAHVVLDPERRREIIRADARTLAQAQNLELVEDEGLVEETAGLVEWPVALMGAFDEEFLEVPDEVIRATIRANQKCFVLRRAGAAPRAAGEGRVGVGFGSLTRRLPSAHQGDAAAKAGRLANRFIMVANLDAADGGAAIVHGNERVVRARLSDARFFWETDRKTKLKDRLEKLKSIIFHEKLGTQFERVERIARLAKELAPLVGADPENAETAARLAKADLVTEMVGEFPELQGLMGRYYAQGEGLDDEIAFAIEEHYRPQGPSDRVPTAPVSIAVALADKIDTLVGFWAIDEKPTGSKDPYALRRAALGVVRIVLENGLRVRLDGLVLFSTRSSLRSIARTTVNRLESMPRRDEDADRRLKNMSTWTRELEARQRLGGSAQADESPLIADLIAFLADRLKVQLREQGARHDLVDAALAAERPSPLEGEGRVRGEGGALSGQGVDDTSVEGAAHTPDPSPQGGGETRASSPLPGGERSRGEAEAGEGLSSSGEPPHPALRADLSPPGRGKEGAAGTSSPQGGGGQNDDLVLIVRRVEALQKLLETEDGKNLLAGYRRAANILKAEEKKDGAGAFEGAPEAGRLSDKAEIDLSVALDAAEPAAEEALAREDFAGATAALAKLRGEVDAFFEEVTVNAPDPALRANRLRLLARLRRATRAVADFDKIAG